MVCNLNIDTGDFLSFADYFFDGFVVDWVVQDRINNAKKTGRRSNSKNRKYSQSITAYVKEKAMSQKWFIAFRCVMAYFNFSFSAFKSSRFLVKALSPEP